MADADAVLDAWMRSELDKDPVAATNLGLGGYDAQLGEFGAPRWEGQASEDRMWAGRLAELHGAVRSPAQRVDVALVLSHLAGRAALEDWAAWRRDPAVYLDPITDGVFALFLHRLRPEAELVAAACARLGQVASVLAAARANLDASLASPLIVRRSLGACQAATRWFRDLLPAEVSDERLRSDLAASGAAAAEALEDFSAFLDGLAGRARGSWALGEERYSRLLLERELLGYGATELHTRGEAAWADLDARMGELAEPLAEGGTGWRQVVAHLAENRPATPEAMRHAYAEACERARRFLRDRELVTLPDGERCQVVPSPSFLRPVLAVASYQGPPPFSSSRTGWFFVPYPPEGSRPHEIDERLADNSLPAVPSTAVHEAYPGHHWQLTWAANCPRRVRSMIRSPYFVEGWALYAEAMMADHGFFADPGEQLCHLDARIFRAARMVVDTALHCGDMTVDEAVASMVTKASLTDTVARAEVERYCAWPTQAPSYLTGALEIERLRRRWEAEGRGSLRGFHDALAASPGLPIALAEVDVFGARE